MVGGRGRRLIFLAAALPSIFSHMKSILILVLVSGVGLSAHAQVTYLTNQHMDFRLRYDASATGSNRLDVILGYDPGQRATNDQIYIVANTNAQLAVPGNASFAFLGSPGAPIWILPQSQNVTLPYLGISAEDIPAGVFNDPMELELVLVEGPGNFFAWAVSGARQPPDVKFIATNGVVSPQFRTAYPFINNHEHNNWAFSANGLYRVTLRVNGQFLSVTTNTLGCDVAWAFQILPLRPWEHWISTNWLPATASITNGPAADPDGDGIPNALEYALGLNPNAASATRLPTFSLVSDAGQTYGALTFTRVKTATDIDYLPSVRSELATGVWTKLTNIVSMTDHGETESVTLRDFAPAATNVSRYFQFRARLNYP
jgi:surface-anchored protein